MDDWNDGWMTEEESDAAVARYRANVKHDIEAFDAMLNRKKGNDWRDEGTEANKRVERLLSIVGVFNAATFPLAAGAGVAVGIASIYHTSDHANDWLFLIASGIVAVGWIANITASLALKKIRAITEDA